MISPFRALLLISCLCLAQTCVADWIYTDNGTSITINQQNPKPTGSLDIPAFINGKPVTSIGDYAFYSCTGLTSVTIPSSVTSIGKYAFYSCSGLTSVTIPVTSVGEWAFSSCTGLTSVTIPSSVTSIGNYAFDSCIGLTSVTIPSSVTSIGSGSFSNSGLTSVTIPSSVTSIGDGAFQPCSGLTAITVESANPNYCSVDGVLFDKLQTILIQLPEKKTGTYEIPSSVTSIGNNAIYYCIGLTSVTIPSSVTSIGSGAFIGCIGLTSVTIPSSVTSIGSGSFSNSGLTSVTIPSSLTSIGEWAFSFCTGLTSVTFPSSITSIGNYAFYSCSALKNALFLGNAPNLGYYVFYSHASGFTVFFKAANTGFTMPEWYGHPTVAIDSGFTGWLTVNAPDQAANQDHDQDGVPNGVEYFMGNSGNGFTANPGIATDGTVTWPKSADFSGSYQIQTSNDLRNWTDVTNDPAQVTNNPASVIWTRPETPENRFVRLVIFPN